MNKLSFKQVGIPVLIAAICTALTGCNSKSNEVLINKDAIIFALKTQLTSKMKDPNSVQFRNVTFYPTTLENKDGKKLPLQVALCGEVNRTVSGDSSEYNPFISTDTLTISEGVPTLEHKQSYSVMINSAPRGGGYFEEVAADVCQNEARPPKNLFADKPADPREIFKVGTQIESDKLSLMLTRNYPNAKYFPNQSIQVTFESKSYLIQTRKLNDTGPAVYEIVSVSLENN